MATYEELFPDEPVRPFEPIETGRTRAGEIKARARLAINPMGAPDTGFEDAFGDLLSTPPAAPQSGGETNWSDYGRAAVAGAGDIGQSAAAIGEYAANRAVGEGNTPFEQGAADVAGAFTRGRVAAQDFAQDWASSMSPEAQARAMRELTTLDPNRTIWQGGPSEALSSIGLKMARSAPSTLATLLPGALMMRAGLGGGAIAYLGASEGGLSLGSIAANIAQEVEQAPEDELMQSQSYQRYRQTMDEPQARQALIREAQGYAPVIGGLVVGAISAAAGRYLEPVLTDHPAGVAGRFARGFASEGLQESGQSGVEQIAQNVAAMTFDKDRSPMQDVGEQAIQGGVVGGLMGGATTAAVGPRPRAAIDPMAGRGGAPDPGIASPVDQTQQRGADFDSVFGDQAPAGGWRGGDTETAGSADLDATGQKYMQLGPVDPAVQAALNARADNKITDMFDPAQQASPTAGPGGTDMQEVWTRNEQMDLPQGPPGPGSAVTAPPGQMGLPLTQRTQGVGRVPVEPATAQPMVEDMSAPPSVSNERLPGADLLNAPARPTRADFLRQKAEQDRAGRYKGTVRDENQIDMISGPDAPADAASVQRLRAALMEAVDTAADPSFGELIAQVSKPGITRGELAQIAAQYAQKSGFHAEGFEQDTAPNGMPDQPSAEPLGDLIAQLEDLRDPDSDRSGVYLSRDNIENLRQQGTFERVRGAGVPLPDFDGKGGTLIAKNRKAADELLAARAAGHPLQEILGIATGAGVGKALGADIAVQQRDEQGNVVRESLVGTPEEADALAENFDQPGREGVILSAPMAIRRRAQLIKQEGRNEEANREIKSVRRKAEEAISSELGEGALARATLARTGRKSLSENEVARRLVGYAARLRKKELRNRVGDIDSPKSLEFKDLKAQQAYEDLFGQYRDSEIAEHMSSTAADKLRNRAKREGLRRQLGAFRRLNQATTPSEKVARVARRVSAEEVQKIEREARETARSRPETEGDILEGATADVAQRATPEQLAAMSPDEVNLLFVQAANYFAGRRVAGRTFEQLVTDYPTPSERRKLIGRYQMALRRKQFGGKVKALPITGTASTKSTATGETRAQRRRALSTRVLTVENPQRELSAFERNEHNKRVRAAYSSLSKAMVQTDKLGAKLASPKFVEIAQQREADGNPPQAARDVIYGKAYLRTLYEYARALQQAYNRSPAALREIERTNKIINDLAATDDGKLPRKLSALFHAETREQVLEATAVDPKRLGNLRSPRERLTRTLKQLAKLKEHLAWHARLDEKWHTNGHFNSLVAPLMRKFSDSVATNGYPSYRPTFQEMNNLRFALRLFRSKDATREALFKPLKRWFADLGFKFDGQDLAVKKSAFEGPEQRLPLSDHSLLAQARRRFGKLDDRGEGISIREATREAQTPGLVNRKLAERAEFQRRMYSNDEPLTESQVERFGKTEAVNRGIEAVRRVARSPRSTALDLIAAEEKFFDQMKEMGLLEDVGVGKQLKRIGTAGRYGTPVTVRPLTPRIRSGALSNAEAKDAMLQLYKPIPLTAYVKQAVSATSRAGFQQTSRTVERGYTKAERDRRAQMTPEQRRALEALDRQDSLDLDLQAVNADMPAVRNAGQVIADALEAGKTDVNAILRKLSATLPTDHPFQNVIQRLVLSDMKNTTVHWDDTLSVAGNMTTRGDGTRAIRLNRKALEALREQGRDPSPAVVHAFLHEAIHAATTGAIHNNLRTQQAMWAIMRQAKSEARAQGVSILDRAGNEEYGFRNVDEFVAEAFSNARFQNVLRQIKIDGRTLWQKFTDLVSRLLGIDTPAAKNMLDLVLSTSDRLFTGEVKNLSAGMEQAAALNIDKDAIASTVGNVYDKVLQSSRIARDVRAKAKDTIEGNKEGGTRFLLSALTMEQMRDFYARAFGGGRGPLSEYMKAFFQRNADNSANMETADKLSRRWTELTERLGAEDAVGMSRMMADSTLYGIHPDLPLSNPANAHVKSAAQQARHAELARQFRALPPEMKQLYADVKSYYAETLKRETNLMALNALRAAVGGDSFNYTEADMEGKKLGTVAGMEAEFGDKLTQEERKTIARMASIPQRHIGPYFPLMRFGDYVVTAERTKEEKTFPDAKSARDWATAQREDDPTVSVSSPIESGNKVIVRVTEKEVRMAESPSEAEQNHAEMVAEYGADNVSQPQLKAQLYNRGASISSSSGLRTILGKLDGNPAAQSAIKDFYLRSLADGAFRKREIKRANRRGVDSEAQHRTFANYAKSSAYYTSQLRFGWRMADALIDMQKYVEGVAKGEHSSDLSPIRMGEVVREIDTRDKLTHDHVEVSKLVRAGTELSQFMMLTSPSYWMINATQPYMVSLPWLAARTSIGDATAALTNAQKLIASPIVNQMGASFGGLKALWSKTAAEKAFTVIDQVEEYIKQRGGERASEYIDMLNKLRRESIIDLSFVAELRDIAQGQDSGLTQRVLDASRIMSHLSEVNNRILTSIAAYDLYRNRGASVLEATEFAKQAVSLTQFNYSAGNAPRLFQARGPLGAMGPLVFQFMKYPQHMYALLIDNMRRAVYSGGMDRKVALKTLAGLFATHLAAGGIIGAMLQPIKWAIGLALAAFGDDDEPYTLKNALSGETFDRLIRESVAELFGTSAGEILSAGIPRAAGIDLSNRMSLGTLYFIDLKTDTAESTVGSLAGAFGGPLVNLGMGFWKGAQYMQEGQVAKGLEAFLPKAAKDALKTIRYSSEGLTDATGKEIIGAKDMSPWQLFMQSIGFQPSQVSEAYARRAAIKDAESYDKDRRNTLMRRFQNADPAGRQQLAIEIAAFNKANPAQGITRSQLIKSIVGFKQREARVRKFGVDLRGKDVMYEEAGEPYSTN